MSANYQPPPTQAPPPPPGAAPWGAYYGYGNGPPPAHIPPQYRPPSAWRVVVPILVSLVLVAGILVTVAIIRDRADTVTTTLSLPPAPSTVTSPTITVPPAGEVTAPTVPPAPVPPEDTIAVPESIPAGVGEILDMAIAVRGLPLLHDDFTVTVLTQEQFEQRNTDDIALDFEEYEAEYLDFEAFAHVAGLLPEDRTALEEFQTLYAGGTAGFYDPEPKEIVIPDDGQGYDLYDTVVLVHEFTHLLQDQHFPWYQHENSDGPDGGSLLADEGGALRALLEGDAVTTENVWLDGLSQEQYSQFLDDASAAYEGYEPPDVSRWVEQGFAYLYEDGPTFVDEIHEAGGFAAVNALYGAYPTTTEQIRHVDRYTAGEAATPPPALDLATPAGYVPAVAFPDTLGEISLALWLAEHVGAGEAESAADGWGGDMLYGFREEASGRGVFVYDYVADSEGEAAELDAAMLRYATARWGGSPETVNGGVEVRGADGGTRTVWDGTRITITFANDVSLLGIAGT